MAQQSNFRLICGSCITLMLTSLLSMAWAVNLEKFALPRAPTQTTTPHFLPAEQAFKLNYRLNGSELRFDWQIAPGHSLYKQSIHISTHPAAALQTVTLPPATTFDAKQDHVPLYQASASAHVMLNTNDETIALSVNYQGCADRGYCYPPVTLYFRVQFATGNITPITQWPGVEQANHPQPRAVPPITEQNRITDTLIQGDYLIIWLVFFGFGLLLCLTPCVLPMLPILSSIILVDSHSSRRRAFFISVSYVLGIALTYGIAGTIAGLAGSAFQTAFQTPWVLMLVALLFFLLAGALFDLYPLQLPQRVTSFLTRQERQLRGGTLITTFFMGILSALIVSPCVTAPLVAALTYIGQTGNAWLGGSALFALGLGMGTPLIAIAVLGVSILPPTGPWMQGIKYCFGILLIVVALSLLARFVDASIMLAVWAVFFTTVSVALATIAWSLSDGPKIGLLSLALCGLCYGCILLFGFARGADSLRTPLVSHNDTLHLENSAEPLIFQPIANLSQFKRALAQSQQAQQATLVRFTAQWCASCSMMKRTVIDTPEVQALIRPMTRLVIDMTHETPAIRALRHALGIFAPPTYLFYDSTGQEQKSLRLVAQTSKHTFIQHLNALQPTSHLGSEHRQ